MSYKAFISVQDLQASAAAVVEVEASELQNEASSAVDAAEIPHDLEPTSGAAQVQQDTLWEEERALNEAAMQRVQAFTIHLVTGCFLKQLSSRRKFAGSFCAASVGNRHVHFLQPEWGLAGLMQDGSLVAAEGAKYLVNLKQQQAETVKDKIVEWGSAGGFVPFAESVAEVADAHILLLKPKSQSA